MFKEIDVTQIGNAVDLFNNRWALVTAGSNEAYNTMTVSWGSMGELWGKAVATVYIRPQRYTEEFLNSNDYFTVSVYPQELKKQIHSVCGSKSGRDINKAQKCNITPCFDEKAPFFEEAELVLVCRKLAKSRFAKEQFIDADIDGDVYPEEDYHYIYYGEIEKVLISK